MPSGAVMEFADAIIQTNGVDDGTGNNPQNGFFIMFRGVGPFESLEAAKEYLETNS